MNQEDEYLNVDNFRRWMKSHPEPGLDEGANMVGIEVQAKFGAKKTIRNMVVESGKAGRVIRQFMEGGGTIRQVSDDEYLIEVASGTFLINKKFVVI